MNIQLNDIHNEVCFDVVITTIYSLSRSISGYPFPNAIKNNDLADKIIKVVADACETLKDKSEYKRIDASSIDVLTRKILEEAYVIPSSFNENVKKELFVNETKSVAMLVNFSDHLAIKTRASGFSIKDSCEKIFRIERDLSKSIPFVFDEELGYVVSNIHYFGTALFQSVLLSIPGIVMMGRLSSVIKDFQKNGLNINGYYSQRSNSSMGWVYYIYNENAIGGNENEQILSFSANVLKIIYLEREMRLKFYLKNKVKTLDMITRAYAIARAAIILDTGEAMDLVFKIKMGLELNAVVGISHEECNSLFYKMQVAHIVYSVVSSNSCPDFKCVSDQFIKMERAKLVHKFVEKVDIFLNL